MIETDIRLNAVFEQAVHQPVIKIQSLFIDDAVTFRQDARPGCGKTIRLQAYLSHQAYIFLPAVIVIDRCIPVLVIGDLSRCVRKGIPYRGTFSVLIPSPFDLVG